MWIVFAAAVVPALLLLYYVYSKDFYPEPKRLVFKGFGFGALAVFASLFISVPIQAAGLFTQNPGTLSEAVGLSFMGAAIPEESAKLFMLWLYAFISVVIASPIVLLYSYLLGARFQLLRTLAVEVVPSGVLTGLCVLPVVKLLDWAKINRRDRIATQ